MGNNIRLLQVDYRLVYIPDTQQEINISYPSGKNMALVVLNSSLVHQGTFYYNVSSSTSEVVTKMNSLSADSIVVLQSSLRSLSVDYTFFNCLKNFGLPEKLNIQNSAWKNLIDGDFNFIGQKGKTNIATFEDVDYLDFIVVQNSYLKPYMYFLRQSPYGTPGLFAKDIIKSVKYTSRNQVTLSFGTINYVQGKTYNVNIKFRTRGDGDSTSSKCSSIGFIAHRPDWSTSYSYIHYSATAYAERGKFVEWTYTFTAIATEARPTALYFIIDNGWAAGYDNQTMDLYYYKMWDNDGYVYAQDGNTSQNIVNKWSDGTAISGEKAVTNTTANENYLWSEIIKPSYMIDNTIYTIDYDAKRSGDSFTHELFLYSSDYQTTGYITSKSMGTPLTEYRHYSHTFNFKRNNASSTLPSLRIRFDNNGPGIGKSGTLYVKNVKLRVGRLDKPMFLKKKNDDFYYKLYIYNNENNEQNLKLQSTNFIIKQNCNQCKYGQLSSRKYSQLKNWEMVFYWG